MTQHTPPKHTPATPTQPTYNTITNITMPDLNTLQCTDQCITETGILQVKQYKLFYRLWRPKVSHHIRFILHINHGMTEHSGRYTHFAERCAQQGIATIAQDHPSHGQSIHGPSHLGHITDKNSWKLLIKCVQATQNVAHQLFGDIPTLLFGHSMGSFATLHFLEQNFITDQLQTHGLPLAGVILSGSTQNPWYLNKSLQLVARLERWRQGSRNLKKLPTTIPFLLISGDQDPLSDHGGLHRLEQSLISAGVQNITSHTFPHGRHELLNELNHEEVEHCIFQWLATLSPL